MKNFIQKGDTITVPAPATLVSGQGILVGNTFGVAAHAAASGADVSLVTTGVFELPAASAATGAVGALMYWDVADAEFNATASSNFAVGSLVKAKTSGQTTVTIRLHGTPVAAGA